MSRVVALKPRMIPVSLRAVEPVEIEDFCTMDARGEWVSRMVIEGTTVLLYDDCNVICDAAGFCFTIRHVHADMDAYLRPSLAATA